jgi:hypothetical protein
VQVNVKPSGNVGDLRTSPLAPKLHCGRPPYVFHVSTHNVVIQEVAVGSHTC